MTQEEKARAYDKAIEKIKYVMEHGVSPTFNKEDLQDLFPELKESEDERIRKSIIHLVNISHEQGGYALSKDEAEEMLAWIEKQGEPFNDNIITRDDEILQAISIGLTDVVEDAGWSDFGGIPIEEIQSWLEKQSEQKWSDTDEELLRHCCGAVAAADYYTLEDKEEMENWLKSLKKRMEE